MTGASPILAVRGIGRTYSGVVALDDVSIDLLPGEVHAVCGENGAGKTTLMRILAGATQPDTGTIELDGETRTIRDPIGARQLGIGMIHQELDLTPQLSVAENVHAGTYPRRLGILVDRRRMFHGTHRVFERLGVHLDPRTQVGALSIAQRQLVEIAKALVRSSRILIMDEPTASLSRSETEGLLRVVRDLRGAGLSVLYVSHRLEEVMRVSDRVTVLRDGRLVGTVATAATSTQGLVRMMVGRDVRIGTAPRPVPDEAPDALRVSALSNPGVFQDVSLRVRQGEILGLYGLVGAGRTEIARALFGLDPRPAGTVHVGGSEVRPGSPQAALAAGLAYASEDRKGLGLILSASVEENLNLAAADRVSVAGAWIGARSRRLARELIGRLDVRPPEPSTPARSLSGGNQQKVVIGKWLATRPRAIIFDEPTRGVDIGAKQEIYARIRELAAEGAGVVVISSELLELLEVPHRICVVRNGRIVAETTREEATEERLMAWATGVPSGASAA